MRYVFLAILTLALFSQIPAKGQSLFSSAMSAGDYGLGFDKRGVRTGSSPFYLNPAFVLQPTGQNFFLPNMQVDQDPHPEHREPATVFGQDEDLLLTYALRESHWNPEYIMFTRSSDKGKTWMNPATVVNDVTANATIMPSIAQLSDGTIGVVWDVLNFSPFNYEVRFAASLDGGLHFLPSIMVHPPDVNTDFLRPWITAKENTFYVGYIKRTGTYQGHIAMVSSSDGGITWNSPISVNTTHPMDVDGEPPKIMSNTIRDELAVVWESSDHIWFSKSSDQGTTWTASVRITDADTDLPDFPEMAVDSQGRYVVVWDDFRDDWVDVFIDSSMDGVTWGEDRRVNDPYVSGNQYEPHIHIDSYDNIHLTWNRNIPFQFDVDLYYTYSEDGGASWYEPNPRVNDVPSALIPYVTWSSDLVSDPTGRIYIFWNDGRETGYYDHVYFTRSDDLIKFFKYKP